MTKPWDIIRNFKSKQNKGWHVFSTIMNHDQKWYVVAH